MTLPAKKDVGSQLEDPVVRGAVRATVHVRRYLPLYVLGTVWVVMLALFPTIDRSNSAGIRAGASGGPVAPGATGGQAPQPGAKPTGAAGTGPTGSTAAGGGAVQTAGGGSTTSGAATTGGGAATSGGGGASSGGATTGGATTSGGASTGAAGSETTGGTDTGGGTGASAGGGETSAPAQSGPNVPSPEQQSGVTRGGVQCSPGVRQVPFSDYAAPCVPKFEGNNGGTTYRGVTADTIRIGIRYYSDAGGPNQQVVDSFQAQAGLGSPDDRRFTRDTFIKYLNDNMELYGRQVKIERFDSQGISTDEAQSKGRETACADAAKAAQNGYFGVVHDQFGYISEPFAECASTQQHLFVPLGGAYFPEQYYQRWHPYVFGTVMECERIAHQVAEYLGKRLNGKPAKWAKDVLYQNQNRVFGTYVPNNDGYQRCVNISESDFKDIYGGKITWRYNYVLDVSQFATEAARAVPQFKAAGVTTFLQACDTYPTLFLTQQAKAQSWGPEWLIIGVAGQDTENFARQWDQDTVAGHLFGMSQLGNNAKLFSKDGEAYKAFKAVNPDKEPPGDATATGSRSSTCSTCSRWPGPTSRPTTSPSAPRPCRRVAVRRRLTALGRWPTTTPRSTILARSTTTPRARTTRVSHRRTSRPMEASASARGSGRKRSPRSIPTVSSHTPDEGVGP